MPSSGLYSPIALIITALKTMILRTMTLRTVTLRIMTQNIIEPSKNTQKLTVSLTTLDFE